MAMKEIDVLGAAVAATEKEIFGDAFSQEEMVLDETGDRTVEQMGEGLEGQHEPDDDDEELESDEETGDEESDEGKASAKGKDDDGDDAKAKVEKPDAKAAKTDPEGRVPPGRLREQTDRTKAAEAERDALKAERDAERREMAELKAKFEGVLAALQRQPAKETPAEVKPNIAPDLFEDPKGFVDHLTNGFQSELQRRDQQMDALRVETSMQIAYGRHGEVFDKAFAAVQKLDPRNPDDQVTVRRIYASPNAGEALVQWHKRNETLREVGDDPIKYRETVAAETRAALMADPEFRKQLVAELRGEASIGDNGKPRTITKLPKSLNGAAGGNSRDSDPFQYDDSDGSVFQSAWGS